MTPDASPHLLVLEDNPDDEALLRRVIEDLRQGVTVEFARDGFDGLERLRADRVRRPAAVLVDLKMPRMNGFDFLRAARADPAFAHLPLIVFTSSDEASDIRRAYQEGASAYVQKPTAYEAFSQVVGAIIQFWLRTNEPPRSSVERLQRAL